MAGSALEERENDMLKGHIPTIPNGTFTAGDHTVRSLDNHLTDYLERRYLVHYGRVEGRPQAGGEPLPPARGVTLRLTDVVCGSQAADDASMSGGISLLVPPGQSVALFSQHAGVTACLLDVAAGLRRPRSGRVRADRVAVDTLSGAELDRYRAHRGLISARFPLLSSLSIADNVLAGLPSGRPDAATRGRVARLLEVTGAAHLSGPVDRLAPHEQWRVMVARALLSSPGLVLAEDPAPGVDKRSVDIALDVLVDAHAMFGFTLVFGASSLATAIRCQRLVTIVNGVIAEDEMTVADDPWTRGRIDRIG
jgi:predicted ABC-type transport system involved in lysophospholipase L1 biosynthesis ATPase subunit